MCGRIQDLSLLICFLLVSLGRAQTGGMYNTVSYSANGQTIYATTLISGNMSNNPNAQYATHTYNVSVGIKVPSGTVATATNSEVASGASPFSLQASTSASALTSGSYTLEIDDTAYCSVLGADFLDAVFGQPIIPPPTINAGGVVVNGTSTTSFAVGASGYMNIWGMSLMAEGTDPAPTISVDDSNITLQPAMSGSTDQQLVLAYSIGTNTKTGTHSLYVETTAGTSNAGSFTVGDASPIVTGLSVNGVSTSTFVQGIPNSTVITGQNFGDSSVCPQVAVTFAGVAATTSVPGPCSDTTLTLSVTPNSAGSGTISVTAMGFNAQGFVPQTPGESQSASLSVNSVAVNMKLSASSITIDSNNNYSEDSTVTVTAVRSDNGSTVSFPFGVNIIETDGFNYYSQNGGSLPSSISLGSNGTTTFVAKSLAGPNGNGPPTAAQISTAPYSVYGGGTLSIPQWVSTSSVIDPHASGSAPDWFKKRSIDLFASPLGNSQAVLAALSGYTITATACGNPAAGACTPQGHVSTSITQINPYATSVRINGVAQSNPTTCGVYRDHEFQDTFYHEARHAYQYSLTVNSANDRDQDYLVSSSSVIAVSPSGTFVDSTTPRTVCNPPTLIYNQIYSGDSVADPFSLVVYALEEDAYTYEGQTVP